MDWLKGLAIAPVLVIVWFMDIYKANRARLAERLTSPGARSMFKLVIGLTMLVWLVVWLTAGEADRGRLAKTLKAFMTETFPPSAAHVKRKPGGRLKAD